MKVTHGAGSVATKNLLDGQYEVFGPISEDRLCSGVAVLPGPFQNVNSRFCVFCRCDADGDGDILMGGVRYAHHGDKEIV